jgi:hypothetical protein
MVQNLPNKLAKGDARKAYIGVIKKRKATAAELLTGVQRYAQEQSGKDPQFTKHPATWLNKECWLDEPTAAIATATSGKPNAADSAIAGMARYLNRPDRSF